MRTRRNEGLAVALLSVLIHAPLAAQTATWTQVATTGPAARYEHAMAYDSQRGRTVLFGGRQYNASVVGDTWEWDGGNWTQVSTTGPGGRILHAMAYDSQRGRTVMFGGLGAPADTWEWDGSIWTQVSATGPAARYGNAMVYDSQRGRTLLFGGETGPNAYLGDTWEWDGGTWAQVAITGPPPREGHTMACDSQRGRTVLFGGGTSFGNWSSNTWEWDGSAWTQVSGSGPPSRGYHRMAYDSQRRRTVLFGGLGIGGNNNYLGNTWEWDGDLISTAAPFGSGCGSPALVLSPITNVRPTIGSTAQASLTNTPSSLAFVAVGWSNTLFAGAAPLPISLATYGMPGCDLLQSTEAAAIPTTPSGPGTATYSWTLPNWSGLIGLHIYLQGWAAAPGANTANVIVSNGVEWVTGNS